MKFIGLPLDVEIFVKSFMGSLNFRYLGCKLNDRFYDIVSEHGTRL